MRWVSVDRLDRAEFPAANRAIIDALQLPDRYMITANYVDADDFFARLEVALKSGVRMVQYRDKSVDCEQRKAIALEALRLCRMYSALLIINAEVDLALEIGADGVHLNSVQLGSNSLVQLQRHMQTEPDFWLGASCHNAAELEQAASVGVRYVSLSPVQHTASHPETLPLGWHKFEQLVERIAIPVFALGGMNTAAIDQAIMAGGQGVAAIREYWD